MSLPSLKKYIYASIAPGNTADSTIIEAMMNIMQATSTVLQSLPHLDDTISMGVKTFLALFSQFVTVEVNINFYYDKY